MLKAVQSQAAASVMQTSRQGDKNNLQSVQETKETSRAAAIKEQIANGSYRLDMQETAKSIAKELLG